MLDAGGMAAIGAGMASFKQAAEMKQFTVSPEGGDALLAAIKEMALWVDDNMSRLGYLARQQPLGSSHGAEAMKPYLQEVVTDQQGFVTQLREFRASLADAEQGVIAAMDNYGTTDQDAGGNFGAV
jgi:hypothetical protein